MSTSSQSNENDRNGPVLNTDRELYREDTGDPAGSYYENSLHVTDKGTIGMSVGGHVITLPIAEWHALASHAFPPGVEGRSDPTGGDGYVPGAWDEVRSAYLDGHISAAAYDALRALVFPPGKNLKDDHLKGGA